MIITLNRSSIYGEYTMSNAFTKESFQKTFVRTINNQLRSLGVASSELDAKYIKERILAGYEKHLFSRYMFDAGCTFDINLDDSSNVVVLSNDTIWLTKGYYISHSKYNGQIHFTLRKLNDQVFGNYWHSRLIGIRYKYQTIFFGKGQQYNLTVAIDGSDIDYSEYLVFDITDTCSLKLEPHSFELTAMLDRSWNGPGLKLEIKVGRPALDRFIRGMRSYQNSDEWFYSLICQVFGDIRLYGGKNLQYGRIHYANL